MISRVSQKKINVWKAMLLNLWMKDMIMYSKFVENTNFLKKYCMVPPDRFMKIGYFWLNLSYFDIYTDDFKANLCSMLFFLGLSAMTFQTLIFLVHPHNQTIRFDNLPQCSRTWNPSADGWPPSPSVLPFPTPWPAPVTSAVWVGWKIWPARWILSPPPWRMVFRYLVGLFPAPGSEARTRSTVASRCEPAHVPARRPPCCRTATPGCSSPLDSNGSSPGSGCGSPFPPWCVWCCFPRGQLWTSGPCRIRPFS